MATTESRSGFRLPWAGARDETTDADLSESTATAGAYEDATTESTADPTTESENTMPSSTGQDVAADAAVQAAPEAEGPAAEAVAVTASAPAPAAQASATPASGRKPTKFLADLTKAMQAAAEAERQETLELFQLEAKSQVETIHARSATEAEDLRKRADEDIAEIRDWSKQEIARIREETENRIASRKSDLTEEIDAHAARIEREIERVHATVESFEQQMASFFEALLRETDPTRFAAMAANLPEPPALDGGQPDRPAATVAAAPAPESATDVDESPAQAVDPWRDAPSTAKSSDADTFASAEPVDAVEATEAAETEAQAVESTSAPEEAAVDQEAAFAAIEAAARAAEATEADAAQATRTPDDAAQATRTPDAGAADATDTAEGAADADDPRLAALGIADFAAAEAEASANLPSEDASESDVADDAVAARLASLASDEATWTPPAEQSEPAEASETRVFVSGLVSVASIAGFKRHLGRTSGIRSVGVTSGPDGEFVFAVAHDRAVDVASVVTALPGFGATVTESGDGVVRATAHDPDQA